MTWILLKPDERVERTDLNRSWGGARCDVCGAEFPAGRGEHRLSLRARLKKAGWTEFEGPNHPQPSKGVGRVYEMTQRKHACAAGECDAARRLGYVFR